MEPDQQLISSKSLPAYLQASSQYAQAEQLYVAALCKAGHQVEYKSTGRSFTFGNNQIEVNEGEAQIVASSKEITELQAMHEQHLVEIKKAKQARLNQLDEECRLSIRRITEDFDEEKKRQQEEAEARRVALQKRTDSDSADEERKRAQSEAALRQTHSQEMVSYEQRRKDAVAKNEAAKAKTEADFARFTKEMQATRDREVANFTARQQEASQSEDAARASYKTAANRMKSQLEAARASLNFS